MSAPRAQGAGLQTLPLGLTRHLVTRIGLGAGLLRGHEVSESVPDASAVATVTNSLELGVRYIDTAPMYGQGDSERLIGRALAGHPLRSQAVVGTKVGFYPDNFDYSAAATISSVRESLRRLGLPRLPLVQVHELRPAIFEAVFEAGGAIDGIRELQAEGLVEHIGVTTSHEGMVREALDSAVFETVLVWKRADLIDDSLLRLAGRAARHAGVAIIVGTPFAGGLLSGGRDASGRRQAGYVHRSMAIHVRRRLESLENVCAAHQVDLGAAALQFVLRDPVVVTTIPGAHSPEHVAENVQRLDVQIPDEFWVDLDAARQVWLDDARFNPPETSRAKGEEGHG